MTKELAIKILENIIHHEENDLIIFGNKINNIAALTMALNALKGIKSKVKP